MELEMSNLFWPLILWVLTIVIIFLCYLIILKWKKQDINQFTKYNLRAFSILIIGLIIYLVLLIIADILYANMISRLLNDTLTSTELGDLTIQIALIRVITTIILYVTLITFLFISYKNLENYNDRN